MKPTPLIALRVELLNVKPVVWRTFIAPASMALGTLHRVLQTVMGWRAINCMSFVAMPGVMAPDPDAFDDRSVWNEAKVELNKALGPLTSFDHVYDFGDGWEHRVTVLRILPPDTAFQWPRCTAGENACPPEDVGGPYEYADFLAAIEDRTNPAHESMMTCSGGRFDRNAFDPIAVNQRLVEIMLRRRA